MYQFFEDMKKDERELRLRDSKSVEAAIRPRDQDYGESESRKVVTRTVLL